ncbi:hypothetical protein THAOC_01713, partial [Thalassiosira oceanica]
DSGHTGHTSLPTTITTTTYYYVLLLLLLLLPAAAAAAATATATATLESSQSMPKLAGDATAKIYHLTLSVCWIPFVKPASGVQDDDEVYPARPSALYTPTDPLGRSKASVDLIQPSMQQLFSYSARVTQEKSSSDGRATLKSLKAVRTEHEASQGNHAAHSSLACNHK